MRVLGMISGTSHDGIDVAVVDFAMVGGTLAGRIEYSDSVPYDPRLRGRIIAALPPALPGFEVACELDTSIGQAFAAVAADALAAPGAGRPDLICSHGQTVFHWVTNGHAHGTLQLGQPAWIAEATGLPVLSDVRSADVAAGGEGAPLVPVLDRMLLGPYRAAGVRAAALNLGGIANMTVCAPGAEPVAWDIGPANALIDAVVTAAPSTPDTFDRDGALAAAGSVIPALLTELLTEPYYTLAPPKSSGKELFHLGYLREVLSRAGVSPDLPDLVATLTELTAVTVADAVASANVQVLVAAGGGVHNPVLMRRLAQLLPGVEVLTTDRLGVPSDVKEAVAFALIGWATAHGLPGNVPSCTGASGPRVLGRISPAPGGRLPQGGGLAAWPAALSFTGPAGQAGGEWARRSR
ncbi:MAG: anhydro-N-acetylmuramic acid kinase [Actinomycetia bacterium]|nr:anhydro-N-acetylmuramic acid kinase [Actinomycetes bacterium]